MSTTELKERHLANRGKVAGAIANFLSHSSKKEEKLKEQLAVVDALVAQKREEFQKLIYSSSSDKVKT